MGVREYPLDIGGSRITFPVEGECNRLSGRSLCPADKERNCERRSGLHRDRLRITLLVLRDKSERVALVVGQLSDVNCLFVRIHLNSLCRTLIFGQEVGEGIG